CALPIFRFWIVKTLIRSSPAARMFIGTPVYLFYLRALGARIGPGAVIFSRRVPVCTDLLTIGAGTVIRKEALFQCYRAQAGRLELGPVTLGRDVFVGERSVLVVLLLYLPLLAGGATLAIDGASSLAQVLDPTAGASTLVALLIEAVILSLVIFFGLALAGLLLVVGVSRLLSGFVKPDVVYPLYGFHDAAHRAIARIGRMRFFTYLFVDSSLIVHFLQWLGYRLKPVVQ